MDEFSDWQLVAGLCALALTILSWVGDYRRMRRRNLDAVGIMPWRTLFFWSLLGTCLLLGLAARNWLAGA